MEKFIKLIQNISKNIQLKVHPWIFWSQNISKWRRCSCWKSAPQVRAVQSTGLKSQLKSKIQIGIVKIHKYALHDGEKKNKKW